MSFFVETDFLDYSRDWEIQEDDVVDLELDTKFQKGSIHLNRKWWFKNLHMPKIVFNSIQSGLDIYQFLKSDFQIPGGKLKNNLSSLNECHFVEESIEQLLSLGVIGETKNAPLCVNPLTVSYRKCTGKKRLCLDLGRLVNPYLDKTKFKFRLEGLPTLSETFSTGYYFFSFDIKRLVALLYLGIVQQIYQIHFEFFLWLQ